MTLVLAAALVLLPLTWQWARHVVTLVHEAGHAGVAAVTGRRVSAIRLHADTSGITESIGRPSGPGMVATALAGYSAPPLVGLGLLAMSDHHAPLAWVLLVVLLVVMVVFIRNWFGLLVVLLAGTAVWQLHAHGGAALQEGALRVLAGLLMFGGLRAACELWPHRRRSARRTSDADLLARLTHVPAAGWNLLFILVAAGCLAGAWRLLVG